MSKLSVWCWVWIALTIIVIANTIMYAVNIDKRSEEELMKDIFQF